MIKLFNGLLISLVVILLLCSPYLIGCATVEKPSPYKTFYTINEQFTEIVHQYNEASEAVPLETLVRWIVEIDPLFIEADLALDLVELSLETDEFSINLEKFIRVKNLLIEVLIKEEIIILEE